MRILDEGGEALPLGLHVESYNGQQTVVLDATWGEPSKYYPAALRLLLDRLRRIDAVLKSAMVDSEEARKKVPEDEGRRLRLRGGREYPLALREEDPEQLRLGVQAAELPIAQEPDVIGGNRTRRIRLTVAPGTQPFPADLEGYLAEGAETSPEVQAALDASATAAGKRPRGQDSRSRPRPGGPSRHAR
jgi:hypothetical protein